MFDSEPSPVVDQIMAGLNDSFAQAKKHAAEHTVIFVAMGVVTFLVWFVFIPERSSGLTKDMNYT